MGEIVKDYDRVLYMEALEACRRCERAAESDDPETSEAGPAAAAIILAEASLEAFVSEGLAVLESIGTITPEARERIRGERKFWNKCSGLYEELSDEPLDRERVYHEKLLPLVKLRHHILHRSADFRTPGTWPKRLAPYRDRIDHVEDEGLHWTSQLLTYRTARWATWAAYLTRDVLHKALPRESVREKFHQAITTWVLDPEPPSVS